MSRVQKLVDALREIANKDGKTYHGQSEEYMDGAYTAFCEQAGIAIEALKEWEWASLSLEKLLKDLFHGGLHSFQS